MKAINYLKQIKRMNAMINANNQELARLEAQATQMTAVMGGERVQASGSQQKMADVVVKMADLKKQIQEENNRFNEYTEKAKQLIFEACDADSITLLYNKYFLYKKWEEIAVEMHFTYQWVSGGLHRRALSQVQKALDERGGYYADQV